MKSPLAAALMAAGTLGLSAGTASADFADWNSINGRAYGYTAPVRAVRAPATAARPTPTRVAAKSDDDGSRPQRRAATTPLAARQPVTSSGGTLSGVASYYWQPQPVASGGRFNPDALTAAHKTLPFGTRVRVTHASNGRSVDVVINDRGPYIAGRIIDLSRRAAQVIGMTGQGIARVNVAILGR